MLTRRAFCALLGALPVIRLLPGVRLGCQHQWEGFERWTKIERGRHGVRGVQCQVCGHIRVTEQCWARWGGL